MQGIATPNASRGPRSPYMSLQLPNTQAQKRPSTTELERSSKKMKPSVNPPTSIAKVSSEFTSACRADELRAFWMQENFQLLREACQQLEKTLSGIADAPIIALEILSNLDRTQIALLSSTTVLMGHDSSALANWPNSEGWKDKEKSAFCHKFTRLVPGSWNKGGILDRWEDFFKVLIDHIHMWSSEACSMNLLEVARDDFDKYDYRRELGILEHQNQHRLCQAKKVAKEGRSEIDIQFELVLKIAFNVMLRQQDLN